MTNDEGFKEYEGKIVFLKLKNEREYTGKVLSVSPISHGNDIVIKILDKYNKKVAFYASEISVIEEAKA